MSSTYRKSIALTALGVHGGTPGACHAPELPFAEMVVPIPEFVRDQMSLAGSAAMRSPYAAARKSVNALRGSGDELSSTQRQRGWRPGTGALSSVYGLLSSAAEQAGHTRESPAVIKSTICTPSAAYRVSVPALIAPDMA